MKSPRKLSAAANGKLAPAAGKKLSNAPVQELSAGGGAAYTVKSGNETEGPTGRHGVGVRGLAASQDLEISAVVYDSRQATPGSLFVAVRGETSDGNNFVSERRSPWRAGNRQRRSAARKSPPGVTWIQVPDARKALALIAANFYGRPADRLALVGITGTNGKTTTAFLLDSIVRAAGHESGLFGTVEYRTPRGTYPALTTTPQSLDLQRFLAEVVEGGGTHAVLEASSHALALDRLWGCRFAAAVFTNLTRDHLDFHGTFEEYFAAKRRLFEGTGSDAPAVGIVNADDAYGQRLVGLAARTITYGLTSGSQVTTKKFALAANGLDFIAETPEGRVEIHSHLVGRINVYNLLAAAAAAVGMGIPRQAIEAGHPQPGGRSGALRARGHGPTLSGGGGLRAYRRRFAPVAGDGARTRSRARASLLCSDAAAIAIALSAR